MNKNPLAAIPDFGQSIWLDYIKRSFIQSGDLKKLIDEDELRGITSNPAIFEEAIARSEDYNDSLNELAQTDLSNEDIFLQLALDDVQQAADLFKGVYEKTHGVDGYVSLEVSPLLALDTEGSIAEARSSWKALDRPNVMIKIPGTKAGLPAIKQLISEGININVTLLFGLDRYREVAEAYIAGLEERAAKGEPLDKVTSVASFFLSRIDTMVDAMLDTCIANEPSRATAAKQIKGQVAISSAKVAYSIYQELFTSDRFLELEAKGAKPQRLLWASTSVKNKDYDDLMYVEALIGPHTVDTLPMETLHAYRDHGKPTSRLHDDLEHARYTLYKLEDIVGIKLADVTHRLEEEGIQKFIKPFESLMEVIAQKRKQLASS